MCVCVPLRTHEIWLLGYCLESLSLLLLLLPKKTNTPNTPSPKSKMAAGLFQPLCHHISATQFVPRCLIEFSGFGKFPRGTNVLAGWRLEKVQPAIFWW